MTVREAAPLFAVDDLGLRDEIERRDPVLAAREDVALDELLAWVRFVQGRLAEADPEEDARPVLEQAARDWGAVRS
ncbi:MAG: hypothetical protein H0U79_02185 [Solirubrobacterales bacterium]|nr:hypothetical protein [Solirubrobacterales bacterium]